MREPECKRYSLRAIFFENCYLRYHLRHNRAIMSGLIVALTAPRALTLFDNKGRVSRYTFYFFFSP